MKKFAILLIPLLITMALSSMNFGCAEEGDETNDHVQDKVEGTTVDSTPESKTAEEGIPLTSDFWIKVNTGEWEETSEGLKVYGAGYRLGHQGVQSKANYNFADSETFIKWKANGGARGEYGAFWVFLMSDYDPETAENSGLVRGGYFTTDHSYKNSVVISEDTWYYTRIKVNADSSYTAVTTTGDYDTNSGTSVYTGTGTYQNAENGKIVVIFNDNYGGTETYLVVGEAKTSAGAPSEVVEPTPTPSAGEKIVTVWICEGVRNATINGGNPVIAGQDNSVLIMIDHPMWAEFDYTDSYGREQHTRIDLDSYYDFFILRENGGWTQVKYRDAYENDKKTCPEPTSNPTPTVTPTATPTAGSLELGAFPSALASDGTNVWVTTKGNGSLNKLRGTDGTLLATYSVGMSPSDVLYDGAYLWVANQGDDTVMKVSSTNGSILGTYPVGDYPVALEYDGENIWVANQKGGTITKLRASDGANLLTYTIPGGSKLPMHLEFDGNYLWVGCYWGYLMRFDVSTNTLQPSHSTGGHISGLAYDGESVRALTWYEGPFATEVRKYSTSQWVWLEDYQLNNVDLPSDITYDGTSFWVADSNENEVIKLPVYQSTYKEIQKYSYPEDEVTYETGDGPADLLYANGYMWVANDREGTVTRIPTMGR